MVLLLILSSLALFLVHDEKDMYDNPVNNGTVINLIFGGLTLSPWRYIYISGSQVNNGTVINCIIVGLTPS